MSVSAVCIGSTAAGASVAIGRSTGLVIILAGFTGIVSVSPMQILMTVAT